MKRTWIFAPAMLLLLSSAIPAQEIEIRTTNINSFGYYSGTLGDNATYFGYRSGYANLADGQYSTFFGHNSGRQNTTGDWNSFFGYEAGYSNQTGGANSFFGYQAGRSNTAYYNSFFGSTAGANNTTGENNSFFGLGTGNSNTTGSNNAFFGHQAGFYSDAGGNSFFGHQAGLFNASGWGNAFFGYRAGYNSTSSQNSFFGHSSGYSNTSGQYNSLFGYDAGHQNSTGDANSFFGNSAGYYNTTGSSNAFFGQDAGVYNETGIGNSFLGAFSGSSNTMENHNSFIGYHSNGAAGITNATAIGYRSNVTRSNSLVLGGVNGQNGATEETNVGIGITNPDRQLTVEGTQAIGRFRRYYGTADSFTRTYAPAFLFERARPTQAAPTDIIAGDYLGKVQFRGRVSGSQVEYGTIAFIASDTSQNGRFAFLERDITTERMSVLNTGNVGIGTTAPLQRLHVVGNVQIDGDLLWTDAGAAMPDYVFEPGYRLMPLDQLETFIAEEKHLPNIPASSQVKDQGLNVTEFQMKLLEKIEELTLYTVQQAKSISHKYTEIASMEARLAALEQIVGSLAKP